MQQSDFQKFATLMVAVGEYYARDVSTALIGIYWEGLKHYEYEMLSKAAQMHLSNPDGGQFFPKIADFTKHIGGGNADRSLVAWSKVDKAVRTVGDHRGVVFDDSIIHAVIADMGGWIGFGLCKMEEWPFKQNDFVKRYRGYLERGDVGEYPAKLNGRADMHNLQIGIDNNRETALIGDQSKALEVLRFGSDSAARNPVTLLADYRPVRPVLRIAK